MTRNKLEIILRKIKIDSLLKNISNKISNYKAKESIDEIHGKVAYMTKGPFEDKPINFKKDFYLILQSVIPQKYFSWAEENN